MSGKKLYVCDVSHSTYIASEGDALEEFIEAYKLLLSTEKRTFNVETLKECIAEFELNSHEVQERLS